MTINKKLGRPKLPRGEARTEILQIRMTKDELKVIEDRAKKADLVPSEWARSTILNQSACEPRKKTINSTLK
jgi:hypothetical protein